MDKVLLPVQEGEQGVLHDPVQSDWWQSGECTVFISNFL